MVTGIVMAGGKGTRMGSKIEKPMIKVGRKPMIQYVIEALDRSINIDKIMILTSTHTPKTTEFVCEMGCDVVQTQGNGYVEDLGSFISDCYRDNTNETILTITADMPLIKSETIDQVISSYGRSSKPAMCVAVPYEIFEEHGLKPSMVLEDVVPSGLNILRSNNKQQDEEILKLAKFDLAVNINSCEDIVFLKEVLIHRDKNLGDSYGD